MLTIALVAAGLMIYGLVGYGLTVAVLMAVDLNSTHLRKLQRRRDRLKQEQGL